MTRAFSGGIAASSCADATRTGSTTAGQQHRPGAGGRRVQLFAPFHRYSCQRRAPVRARVDTGMLNFSSATEVSARHRRTRGGDVGPGKLRVRLPDYPPHIAPALYSDTFRAFKLCAHTRLTLTARVVRFRPAACWRGRLALHRHRNFWNTSGLMTFPGQPGSGKPWRATDDWMKRLLLSWSLAAVATMFRYQVYAAFSVQHSDQADLVCSIQPLEVDC